MPSNSDRPFPIRNITTNRFPNPRFATGFVMVNMKCFFEKGSFLTPRVLKGEKGLIKFQKWRQYFYSERKYLTLPFHRYCEEVQGDWMICEGCNDMTRSWYIDNLVEAGIISDKYRNYHVIGISHDTSMLAYPDRLFMVLGDSVLSFYEKYHNMNLETNIVFLQEILRNDWQIKLEQSGLRYQIVLDTHTDYNGNRLRLRSTLK